MAIEWTKLRLKRHTERKDSMLPKKSLRKHGESECLDVAGWQERKAM